MMQTLYVIVQDHYDRIIKMRETFLLHAHYFQIIYAIYYFFFFTVGLSASFFDTSYWAMLYSVVQ